jgi:two-component system response regulator YesN
MDLDTLLGMLSRKTGPSINPKVQQALAHILAQYQNSLKLNDVASHIGVHPGHLCRLFKKELGISFHRCILMIKVRKACRLLAESEKSIKQISSEMGFSHPEVFFKVFKRWTGCTPGQYRKRH